jgi:ankyrin repeat protein
MDNIENKERLKFHYHNLVDMTFRSMIGIVVDVGCSTTTLQYLLEEGCGHVDSKYEDRTPLYLAVYHRRADLVEILLKAGAKHDKKSGKCRTPPLILAAQRDLASLKLLLRHDPHHINSTDCNGITALRSAVKYGNVETACYLLVHGADPMMSDIIYGLTPLSLCKSGDYFPQYLSDENNTIKTILRNRRQLTKVLEEEDRAYFLYKGRLLHHTQTVVEKDYKKDCFSINHLPEVLKKRVVRKQKLPQVLYTTQCHRVSPFTKDESEMMEIPHHHHNVIQKDREHREHREDIVDMRHNVLYHVWSMKSTDMFRELMGYMI